MQMRILTFDSSMQHAYYYSLGYQLLVERGGEMRPSHLSREDAQAERRLLKLWRTIGVAMPWNHPPQTGPEPEPWEPGDPPTVDPRPYTLNKEGGTIEIRQKPDFARLEDLLERYPVPALYGGVKLDFQDWLSSAEKKDVEDPA